MILKNDYVLLRAIEENDADILHLLINDPNTENHVVGWSFPVSLASQMKWINNLSNDSKIRYMVENQGETVGVVIVSEIDFKNRTAELNIKLIESARGRGIATNAMKLVIKYCYEELNMELLCATVLDDNVQSQLLWKKLGFIHEATIRHRVFKNNRYKDLYIYSLLREEYEKRNW